MLNSAQLLLAIPAPRCVAACAHTVTGRYYMVTDLSVDTMDTKLHRVQSHLEHPSTNLISTSLSNPIRVAALTLEPYRSYLGGRYPPIGWRPRCSSR
ncbi:uncharacterized protein B0H18DRAFT_304378 [Fomitopsis serialis]|uniref:uncharacterized protein n=1 Tax=Fomitopsis serialis TaxID=139415 RepID=UPI0020081F1D|nr:uncharacterized protein B0H18DRAFT_304378 [Neoantrodia serialis]KAH9926946.1 hypothetical protein B0H18DRAFT_304378 [Neoantrodia serialis]